jgi:alpha/beta superfamily hydrolase
MPAEETIDWSLCPLVEVNPRVLSGAPVLCGTRMPVNAFSWVLNEEKTKNRRLRRRRKRGHFYRGKEGDVSNEA